MFQSTKVTSIFSKKPEAADRVRTFKKYQAVDQNVETLIAGNSRVEMGLDPNSPYFENKRVYNIGVPGLTLSAQVAYANNLIKTNTIKRIFMGVDFINFLSQQPVQEEPVDFADNYYADYFSAILSLDALNASIVTVFNQGQYASTRTDKGFNPANDYIPILNNEGQEVLTEQKLAMFSAQINGDRFYKKELIAAEVSSLTIFKQALLSWKSRGIQVVVFINPYQDRYYNVIKKEGLTQDFEIWRDTIKEIAMQTNSRFFDFTDLGKSHSNLKNDEGELAYFWEPAHYKKELGEKMLKTMTSEP